MKRLLLALVTLATVASASAQIPLGSEGKGGVISGSFESNSIVYFNDKALSTPAPEDHFGSNNYLKVNYTYKRLSVGLQLEAYLPALQGYEMGTYAPGYRVIYPTKYIQWQDKCYSILVGDVYEQFGNGIVFRSFEDRQLGFNNALEGGRVSYNLGQYFTIKAMYGRPRIYNNYGGSGIGGADLSLSLGDIFGMKRAVLFLEGSYVNRYERLNKDKSLNFEGRGLTSPNLSLYSARLNLDVAGFTLRTEYVGKGKDLSSLAASHAAKGQAVYAEAGYSYKSLSISGVARMLDNMGTLSSLYGGLGTANTINYLPALTRQYTYMLANLEPHQVNVEGEIGAQGDIYYSYRSKNNRSRYWNFHINYSTYYTLHKSQSQTGERELLWRDLNFDVERQWNKKLKTTFLFSFQERNPYHGSRHRTYVSNIFVADVLYKFTRKTSLRVEAQYLLSGEYEGDWVAGLVELNFAPHWSVYASDMYNIGRGSLGTQKNYFNVGASYTYKRLRAQLAYGRNRAGYICSGGVCRYQPEYTGINISLNYSF